MEDRTVVAVNRESAYEPIQVTHEVERVSIVPRVVLLFDFVFYLIYLTLGIRLALEVFRANPSSGFVGWIDRVTGPLYAPFAGIFPNVSLGGYPVPVSIIIAIVAYAILHGIITALLRMFGRRAWV